MADLTDPCAELVRASDPDRFLSALFAPADRRAHLFVLYAFNIEIARVRDVVREPLPGEIRLQWWREVIEGERAGEAASHPVARQVLRTIEANNLPREAFVNLIEARLFDLYNDPMPSLDYLEGYCGETSSALIRLASIALAGGRDPGAAEAAGHAGVALGITGLLRALPLHRQRGQCYLPADLLLRHAARVEDYLAGERSAAIDAVLADLRAIARSHLEKARAVRDQIAPATLPAYLPVSLVEGDLRRMDAGRLGDRPLWRRQFAIWRAGRKSRF